MKTYANGVEITISMILTTTLETLPESNIKNQAEVWINGERADGSADGDEEDDSKVIIKPEEPDPGTGPNPGTDPEPEPDVDPEDINLRKQMVKQTGSGEATAIHDPTAALEFLITFTLPADLTGYEKIEIQDILPESLEPVSEALTDVLELTIRAGGRTKKVSGTLDYTEPVLSFVTMDIDMLETFSAGEKLELELKVTVKFKEDLAGYPSGITNKARLIINDDIEIEEDGDSDESGIRVDIKGYIRGTVFGDIDQDGQLNVDKGDILKNGVEVSLWDESGTNQIGTSIYTDASGQYGFVVDPGVSYKVKFPAAIGAETLIAKGSDVSASHANPADGFTDKITVDNTKSGQTQIRNAGYEGAVTGEIKGKTFLEEGTLRETAPNVRVTLRRQDEQNNWPAVRSIDIPLGETYRFTAETGSIYKVQFSKLAGNAGLVEPGKPEDTTASHADPADGYSYEMYLKEQGGKQSYIANAGYVEPDIDAEKLDFRKQVRDEKGIEHDSITITDREQVFCYSISFVLPEDMRGFQSIEIQDKLPEELKLAGALAESVNVYIGTEQIRDRDGTISQDEWNEQLISWRINHSEQVDLKSLEGQKVRMEIQVMLRENITELPDEIVNKGLLIINEDTEIKPVDPGNPDPVIPELPGAGDFTKVLIDEEGVPVRELELSGEEQEIQYLIKLKTGSLDGYQRVEIRDELDNRFTYVDAEIKVGGSPLDAATGTLAYVEELHLVSYVCSSPLDIEQLANQTIELYLTVKLAEGVTDYTAIKNVADLYINGGKDNGGEEVQTDSGDEGGGNPVIRFPYGRISGYVFIDEDESGRRDGKHTGVRNAEITLEQYVGEKWQDAGTARTDSDGLYVFDKKAHGQYRINVKHNLTDVKYTRQYTGTDGLNGIVSDVDGNGVAEFSVDENHKHPQPSAGLAKVTTTTPDPNPGGGGEPDPGGAGNNGGIGNPGGSGGTGNNGGGDGAGSGDQSGNGDETVFMKLPVKEEVKAGEAVDYVLSGFGNGTGKDLKKYSITDILPEGLAFISMELPAFTKGSGITYDIVYMTNKHNTDTITLHKGITADSAFTVQAPSLSAGEWITEISVLIAKVPHGFGIGDQIIINCQVDDEPPTETLINDAALGFNDTEVFAKTKTMGIGGAPQTGDERDVYPYTVVPVIALIVLVCLYRYERRRKMQE